jgi:hypothetical protein
MEGGKKAITWIELLKEKLNFLKKTTGRSVSVGEVAGETKKEWVQIKEGKHPKYKQGTSTKHKSSSKKHHSSTKKHHHAEHASSTNEYALMKKVISECPKCQKKLKKLLNKTKKNKHRGGDAHDADTTPDADASADTTPDADASTDTTPAVDSTDTNDTHNDDTSAPATTESAQPQTGGKRKQKKKSKGRK